MSYGSRFDRYVIECRKPDGSLDFTDPQPEHVFGMGAIRGMSDDEIAQVIFRKFPNDADCPVLTGDSISRWPSFIDPRFSARLKYW